MDNTNEFPRECTLAELEYLKKFDIDRYAIGMGHGRLYRNEDGSVFAEFPIRTGPARLANIASRMVMVNDRGDLVYPETVWDNKSNVYRITCSEPIFGLQKQVPLEERYATIGTSACDIFGCSHGRC